MLRYQINNAARDNTNRELKELFHDVGWVRLSRDWNRLNKAIRTSSVVVAVRDETGKLIGLCSALDDGLNVVITYLLVNNEYQGKKVGSKMLDLIKKHYCGYRIAVMTEKAEGFYRKNKFRKISTGLEYDMTNE